MIKDSSSAQLQIDNVVSLKTTAENLLPNLQNPSLVEGELSLFHLILDMLDAFLVKSIEEDTDFQQIHEKIMVNIRYSAENVQHLVDEKNISRAEMKVKFELVPLLKILQVTLVYLFFYKGEPEKEKEFSEKVQPKMMEDSYAFRYEEKDDYPYKVSIVVLGYNHLEYTKECVNHILKNTPVSINYELILINNGSTDGTKEFFELFPKAKQMDFKVNDISLSTYCVRHLVEGRFVCNVSNDVLVGANYLENILACAESDPTHLFIVPTTPNIANLQTIPCEYSSIEDFQEFSEKNNISDPNRWEHRVRLCNPLSFYRTFTVFCGEDYITSPIPFVISGIGFGDDYVSARVRRRGGKCILAKDSLCHHYGSVTLKDEKEYQTIVYHQKKREIFADSIGIDPYLTGFCYSKALFCNTKPAIMPTNQEQVSVLGVETGLGSNPLKIKEILKEEMGNLDCKLTLISGNSLVVQDLTAIADEFQEISSLEEFTSFIDGKEYDYIVYEDKFKVKGSELEVYRLLKGSLKKNGLLVIRSPLKTGKNLLKPVKIVKDEDNVTGAPFEWWIYQSK